MTLADQIIDESEQLAANKRLGEYPYDAEIVETVSTLIRVPLSIHSTGARLAIAAYRRMETARNSVDSIWKVTA